MITAEIIAPLPKGGGFFFEQLSLKRDKRDMFLYFSKKNTVRRFPDKTAVV